MALIFFAYGSFAKVGPKNLVLTMRTDAVVH